LTRHVAQLSTDPLATLKFCFKICIAMRFVDDDDDRNMQILGTANEP